MKTNKVGRPPIDPGKRRKVLALRVAKETFDYINAAKKPGRFIDHVVANERAKVSLLKETLPWLASLSEEGEDKAEELAQRITAEVAR